MLLDKMPHVASFYQLGHVKCMIDWFLLAVVIHMIFSHLKETKSQGITHTIEMQTNQNANNKRIECMSLTFHLMTLPL